MRRAQGYRALILSGGVALYAVGMWLSWLDEQQAFEAVPSWWTNNEMASAVSLLAGIALMLFGTILQGSRLTNVKRALGAGAMIITAIVMVSLWDRGISFLYLAPSIHGWSAGLLLLPLLLVASGIAWLLMAMGGAVRTARSSKPNDAHQPIRANTLVVIVASVLGTLVVLSIVAAVTARTRDNAADTRLHVALDEQEAIASMRVIVTAAGAYRDSYHRYPSGLAELGPSVSGRANEYFGDLIDSRLASGTREGYRFSFAIRTDAQGEETGFEAHADPVSANTGVRHFYVNETGVIRWNNQAATSDSRVVE